MTNARASIDIIVAERRANHLLHEVGLFVGAARRGDAADGIPPVLGLNTLELAGRVINRLVPGDFAPRVRDLGADHGLRNAILVSRIAPRESAFHTRMAMVRFAVLEG